MSKEILLTKESLKNLNDELDYLKNVSRKEIVEKIYIAKERGDLSENAEYHEAKDEQGFLEGKIAELEDKIKNAVIVESEDNTIVNLGCNVTAINESGKEQTFQIVSFNEAHPSVGKISNQSPLGSAFLGQKEGDEVEVELPSGPKKFKIKKISY
jgi:transcription elongation factor GreA